MIVPPTRLLDGRIAFARIEGVSITISKVEQWTVRDADAFIDETLKATRGAYSHSSIQQFVGDLPGAAARKRFVDILAERAVAQAKRTVLLTESHLARGIVTAWAWLTNQDSRAYDPRERRVAIAWLTEGHPTNIELVDRTMVECYRLIQLAPPTSRIAPSTSG